MSRPSIARWTNDDAPASRREWSLTVAGDTTFTDATQPTVGEDLRAVLADADLSVTNLEAPIAGRGSPISKSGPVNEAVAETPEFVREMGFDAVTLANNHLMDMGPDGLEHTVERCQAEGLETCGVGESPTDALDPLRTDVAGQSVALVNVCEREFGAADRGGPGTAWVGHDDATRVVRAAEETADVVVVIAHGGIEYLPFPPLGHQRRLRSFARAGADLVVGHHPHVPQGWERYEGTPICYSLGNFRYDIPGRTKTEWGLLVDATFAGETLASVDLRPVERRDDAVAFMGERWAVDDHRPYFERVSEITADRDALQAHWQELSVRIFEQRYGRWLRIGTGSDLLSLIRHPLQYLYGERLWSGDDRERELLTLLNLVRNESHRDLIETAMSVKTDDRPDLRTPEVRETVRELLAQTEDKTVYDRPSPAAQLFSAASTRLRESVTRTGKRLHPRSVSDRL